ncbi:MAG: shikimate dehydrogenase [Rickettsiales bacterium]
MSTIRTGLIGWPVEHSLSPKIHAYWIKQYGLDTTYELFPTPPELLGQTIADLRREGVTGFNITVPHKQTSMEFFDAVDATAQRIGAANTVSLRAGILHCSNTDAYGFRKNLESSQNWTDSALENALILGAGGAARAAIVALMEMGCKKIVICNRTDEKAESLAQEFHAENILWNDKNDGLANVTLLVNATSLGMTGKSPLEIDLSKLYSHALVHDIVYVPLVTPLLAQAASRGNPTVDGLGMLLYQAQAAFAQWHGITPEVTAKLRAHVLA